MDGAAKGSQEAYPAAWLAYFAIYLAALVANGLPQLSPPDLSAAAEEARQALRLQPDWVYVRDRLMPQIEGRGRP